MRFIPAVSLVQIQLPLPIWLLGQVVKTPPSHGGYRGSNPLGVTSETPQIVWFAGLSFFEKTHFETHFIFQEWFERYRLVTGIFVQGRRASHAPTPQKYPCWHCVQPDF